MQDSNVAATRVRDVDDRHRDAVEQVGARPSPPPAESEQQGELFPGEEHAAFRARWTEVQAGFVDDPRAAIEEADRLVADMVQRIVAGFEADRIMLERNWKQGDEVSTEELRVGIQRYRSFFERLLSL